MFLLRGEWVNKVCVSAGAEREREHVHVCTKMPASLLFFCVGCKLGGFKCTQVYKGHVRWELLNTHNSGKCCGKEVSKSIDISTLKRAHLKSASSLLFSSYLFGSLMPLASPCFVPFLSPHFQLSCFVLLFLPSFRPLPLPSTPTLSPPPIPWFPLLVSHVPSSLRLSSLILFSAASLSQLERQESLHSHCLPASSLLLLLPRLAVASLLFPFISFFKLIFSA